MNDTKISKLKQKETKIKRRIEKSQKASTNILAEYRLKLESASEQKKELAIIKKDIELASSAMNQEGNIVEKMNLAAREDIKKV